MLSDADRACIVDLVNAHQPDSGYGETFDQSLRNVLEMLTTDVPPGSWAQHARSGIFLLTAAEVTLLWAPADPVAGAPSSAAYVIHFTALCPSELQHLAAAYALVNFMDCFAPLALETRFTLVDFDYNFDGSAVCGQLHFDEHLKPVYDWAVSRCQAFDGGDFSFYGDLPACSWGLPVQESAGGSFTSSLENLLEQTRSQSRNEVREGGDLNDL